MLHDYQHVADSESGGHRDAEVARDDHPSVILKKSRPWGEERIANELLLKLGLRVSLRTVRKYMPKLPAAPAIGLFVQLVLTGNSETSSWSIFFSIPFVS
jgi:hypothetical protein